MRVSSFDANICLLHEFPKLPLEILFFEAWFGLLVLVGGGELLLKVDSLLRNLIAGRYRGVLRPRLRAKLLDDSDVDVDTLVAHERLERVLRCVAVDAIRAR